MCVPEEALSSSSVRSALLVSAVPFPSRSACSTTELADAVPTAAGFAGPAPARAVATSTRDSTCRSAKLCACTDHASRASTVSVVVPASNDASTMPCSARAKRASSRPVGAIALTAHERLRADADEPYEPAFLRALVAYEHFGRQPRDRHGTARARPLAERLRRHGTAVRIGANRGRVGRRRARSRERAVQNVARQRERPRCGTCFDHHLGG